MLNYSELSDIGTYIPDGTRYRDIEPGQQYKGTDGDIVVVAAMDMDGRGTNIAAQTLMTFFDDTTAESSTDLGA